MKDVCIRVPKYDNNIHFNPSTITRLVEDGYIIDHNTNPNTNLINIVKDQIETLEKLGLPATFVMIYDELWELWKDYPMEVRSYNVWSKGRKDGAKDGWNEAKDGWSEATAASCPPLY